MTADPREAIALFRYAVISAATNPRLTPAERGQLVRELATQAHEHPDGGQWTYSRVTLDRWIRAYREHGLDGLRPPPRADLGTVRRHPELLEDACQLRLELPARSAAQIASILKARHGIFVPERTIREHLHRRGLHRAALAGQPATAWNDWPPSRVSRTVPSVRPNRMVSGSRGSMTSERGAGRKPSEGTPLPSILRQVRP